MQARVAQRLRQGTVPLLMLSYSYNEFSATAASSQLITIDSTTEHVYDGPDRSRSPYVQNTFFSVALPVAAMQSTVSIYVGAQFWLGNTPAPLSLQIDFGDGRGPRLVTMGSTVTISMPSAARNGTPVAELVIKVVKGKKGASSSFVTNTAATVLRGSGPASIKPDVALGLLASSRWAGFIPTRGIHGPGGRATAIAWIKYAAGNTSGKLRRPLVFVEGIDFSERPNDEDYAVVGNNHSISQTGALPLSDFEQYTAYPNTLLGGYRNGSAGWNELVDYNADYRSLEKFPALRAQLQASRSQSFPGGGTGGDYDLIYLDFSDGATLIQQNAMVLAELLTWINDPANRTADAEETLVVAASMGGQVARFGLAWMEQQKICHNSKLYVSFDSPHRGANVPIGLQYLFDRLQNVWIGSDGPTRVVQDKLLREATMQMVIYHFSDLATPYRQQWQQWQQSPGSYPSLLRKVAIANGSGQGTEQAGMGAGIGLTHTQGLTTEAVAGENYAYALPGASSRGHDNVVFRYKKPYAFRNNWHYTYCDANAGHYDNAPGSFSRTVAEAHDQSDALAIDWPSNTFMATISALDIRDAGSIYSPNLRYEVLTQIAPDKSNPNKYAFDAYFSASSKNEPHVQITNARPTAYPTYIDNYLTDNAAWIRNELRESEHAMPAVLTGPYNYGSPYRHLLPSVQVSGGGVLYLNNGSLPASGGTAATQVVPAAGNFEVYTPNCLSARVQVNSGGQVLVGTSATHTASLLVAANSLLDLRSGGQLTVAAGSVLRIGAGGTLVVRAGSTLTLNGRLLAEPGSYVCLEDLASIGRGPAGELILHPQVSPQANPALNLGPLACQPCLTPGYLVLNDGPQNPPAQCAASSATFTVTDSRGTTGPYSWQVSAGTIVDGQGSSQISVVDLPFQTYTLHVQVSAPASCTGAAPLTQTLSQDYYTQAPDGSSCLSDNAVRMYPNPSSEDVQFSSASPDIQRVGSAGRSGAAEFGVRLYNGQGVLRWQGRSSEGQLRLPAGPLPRGLYGVVITQGSAVSRRTLSLE